jgi:hypothetical protein
MVVEAKMIMLALALYQNDTPIPDLIVMLHNV